MESYNSCAYLHDYCSNNINMQCYKRTNISIFLSKICKLKTFLYCTPIDMSSFWVKMCKLDFFLKKTFILYYVSTDVSTFTYLKTD